MTIFHGIRVWLVAGLLSGIAAAGCAGVGGKTGEATADYQAIVQNPDRSAADRQADERRKPEQLLAFTDVRPGMKVLDVGAGAGYRTELRARVVGPQGVAYAQNTRAREPFDERLQKPAMKNVAAVIRPIDDPVPPEARDLDLITMIFVYHDITYQPADRAQMNRRLFESLRPGGHLVVADHSAKASAGTTVGKSAASHRGVGVAAGSGSGRIQARRAG